MAVLNSRCRARPARDQARQLLSAFRVGTVPSLSMNGLDEKRPQQPKSDGGIVLTRRETELLLLLEEGLSNKAIAERLHIAFDTVKTHLQNIYAKLGTKSRLAAVRKARALGVLDHGAGKG